MRIIQEQLSLAIINAYSFYNMGLGSRNSSKVKPSVGDMFLKRIPETVVFCFASELFLKTLISQYNSAFEKTHELRKLFDSLPQGYRDGIMVAYEMIPWSKTGRFLEELDSISNAFEKLRYFGIDVLQEKKLDLSSVEFAYQFSTILKNLVLQINPQTSKLIQSFNKN